MAEKRLTSRDIRLHKSNANGTPLVALTAYTAPMARLLDKHTDITLVGDSVGMVLYGFESTLPVTLEMMIQHGKAVVNASERSLIVVDLPFGTYQESKEAAFRHAAELIKQTGCQAVKLEGGEEMAETVAFLSERGIPVMGHIGLLPQSTHVQGGYRYQGRTEQERNYISNSAKALEQSGAFAIVLEGISASLATEITELLTIPTIGIGASRHCDCQVLVTEDVLGLLDQAPPRFVKPYASLYSEMEAAIARYAVEVKNRSFPDETYEYEPEN